jgi:uracil-DNA glycosylase family 4
MGKKQQAFYLGDLNIVQTDRPNHKKSSAKVYNCNTCGLDKKCRSPEMERYGDGKLGILLIGDTPGSEEDFQDIPFVGAAGQFLESVLQDYGIDMDRDCVRTNVVRCRTPKSRDPSNDEIKSCAAKLQKDIEEVKPKLIICLGKYATKALISTKIVKPNQSKSVVDMAHGWTFPVHKIGAWVGISYHPSYVGYNPQDEEVFLIDLDKILSHLGKPLPPVLTTEGNVGITSAAEAIKLFEKLSLSKVPVSIDYEATCLSAYNIKAKLLTVALSDDVARGWCVWLANPKWTDKQRNNVFEAFRKFLTSDVLTIVQNVNMEESWSRVQVGVPIKNVIDTAIQSHVINCRGGMVNLDVQVYKMVGHYYSGMVDYKNMAAEPFEKLSDYNCWDARYTLMLYLQNKAVLDTKGNEDLHRFNEFFQSCHPVLSNLKARGHTVNTTILSKLEEEANKKLELAKSGILACEAGLKFKEVYGKHINYKSTKQVQQLFYDIYKVKTKKKTKNGFSTNAVTVNRIYETTKKKDIKVFIKHLRSMGLPTTMLKTIKEAWDCMDDNFKMHPNFLLIIAESFRSSSREPNSQNWPKRDKYLKTFRKCIVPRYNHIILEVDYSGIEARVICMISDDPELTRQIKADIDIHYRWTSKLLKKTIEEVTKDERSLMKNQFVFPSFYGSTCDAIANNTGLPLEHIKVVQGEFWSEYHYVKEWQLKTLADYKQNGYISGLTGFRRFGPLSIEQIYNTPIQGPAFHLLLDGLKRTDKVMIDEGFDTYLYSEIHDSILSDTNVDEVDEYMKLAEGILTSKRFEWQKDIPLAVEWDGGEDFYSL